MVKRKWITAVVIALLLAAGIFFGMRFLEEQKIRRYDANIRPNVTVEAGTETVTADRFLIDKSMDMQVRFADSQVMDLSTPGTYQVSVVCEDYSFTRVVDVVDTTAPVARSQNVTFFLDPVPVAADFVTDIQDVSQVEVYFAAEPDLTVAGDQYVGIVLKDAWGNVTNLNAVLTVILDTQAPVITGVQDQEIYQGDSVSYRTGVAVTDDMDDAPVLDIDSSGVDLSTPGVYTVRYTATDASGNAAVSEATVTVKEKKADYVDVELIYQKADELLATFILEGMSQRDQAKAIYNWMRSHMGYSGHSDKSDWLQGAYTAMVQRTGDCFSYFALSKLFMERLGIMNMDVVKVKNYEGDSSHFWSLVSLDGGESWYHFDTTPRIGEDDNFFLVTDAFLDRYSSANGNCFNRDKSLYPATPEE